MKKVLLIVFLSLPFGLCLAQKTEFVKDDNTINFLKNENIWRRKNLTPKGYYKLLHRKLYKKNFTTNIGLLTEANELKLTTNTATDSIMTHFAKYALHEGEKAIDRGFKLAGEELSEYDSLQVKFYTHLLLLMDIERDIKDWRMINEVDDNIDMFVQKEAEIKNDFNVINNHYLDKVKKEEALRAIMTEYEDLLGVLVYYYRQMKFYVKYEDSILARNTYQTGIDKTKIAKEVVKDMWKR